MRDFTVGVHLQVQTCPKAAPWGAQMFVIHTFRQCGDSLREKKYEPQPYNHGHVLAPNYVHAENSAVLLMYEQCDSRG